MTFVLRPILRQLLQAAAHVSSRWTQPGPRILTYHSIADRGPLGPSSHVPPARFAAQMEWLAAHYSVISLMELIQSLRRGTVPPPGTAVITFDDGYRDNFTAAFPVLKAHALPATIFVVVDWLGTERVPPGAGSGDPVPFLAPEELAVMAEHRISFGCHTASHPSLSGLSPDRQEQEITAAGQRLAEIMGKPVQTFCYPFGDYDATTLAVMEGAGYSGACGEWAGPVTSDANPLLLPRIPISGRDDLAVFRQKLQGGYDWWFNRQQRRRRAGGRS